MVFDRGLTKCMHCMITGSRVFDRCQTKICTLLYPTRAGESRVFGRDLTKCVPCAVPSRSWEVEGFRQGSD